MMHRMGRPREFDIDAVTDRAMQAFWQGGYGGTSLNRLMEATRLEKGSLYKAFGSKEKLFLAALDRYLGAGVAEMESIARSAPTAVEALRAILDRISGNCSGEHGATGCLAVNATVESDGRPESITRRLERHWAWNRSLYERIIAQGQREGTFRDDVAAAVLADDLTRLVIGTAVMCRSEPGAGGGLADRAIALLTPTPAT
jgi:TetR/AcrR family transcriptional repressor of nem operon